MKQIQIVGCCDCKNIVPRVPRRVEDLPIKVQVIHAHFILPSPARGRDPLVLEDLPQGTHVPRSFVAVVAARLSVKDTKEVVVGTGDDLSGKELRKGGGVLTNH